MTRLQFKLRRYRKAGTIAGTTHVADNFARFIGYGGESWSGVRERRKPSVEIKWIQFVTETINELLAADLLQIWRRIGRHAAPANRGLCSFRPRSGPAP
jgi:hypothetical protein